MYFFCGNSVSVSVSCASMRGGALEVLLVRAEGLKHNHFSGLFHLSICLFYFYFSSFSMDVILFILSNLGMQDRQVITRSSNVAIRWLKAKLLQVCHFVFWPLMFCVISLILLKVLCTNAIYNLLDISSNLFLHAEIDQRVWWNEKFRFVLPQWQFKEMPKLTVRLMKRVKLFRDCSIGETMYFFLII